MQKLRRSPWQRSQKQRRKKKLKFCWMNNWTWMSGEWQKQQSKTICQNKWNVKKNWEWGGSRAKLFLMNFTWKKNFAWSRRKRKKKLLPLSIFTFQQKKKKYKKQEIHEWSHLFDYCVICKRFPSSLLFLPCHAMLCSFFYCTHIFFWYKFFMNLKFFPSFV